MNFLTKEQILEIYQFRSATRSYDINKKISEEDFNFILELGRLSPSSAGSEPWKFIVLQNSALREALKPVSWGMANTLDTASHVVIYLAKKQARYDSQFFKDAFAPRNFNAEQLHQTIEMYKKFQSHDINVLENERTLFDWASKQTYIALGNMLTGAALIGIDSCPVEGMDYHEVNRILAEANVFDINEWGVSVAATFGYRDKDPRPKSRRAAQEVIEWIL